MVMGTFTVVVLMIVFGSMYTKYGIDVCIMLVLFGAWCFFGGLSVGVEIGSL